MPRLLPDLQGPIEAELDHVRERGGQQVGHVVLEDRGALAERAQPHGRGLVASAMPLCETCAVRPPSMTSSAPL